MTARSSKQDPALDAGDAGVESRSRHRMRWLFAWPIALAMLVGYLVTAPAHARLHGGEP